ncbi:hypothetical protein [Asanoa iriomotensis]|uniref:Uncharacterized protein n=1 Tax=Asanoa iriomotensis TaxID=234613 RepID=A0ABQ4CFB0_9ACTN|nr:hypothetical protein [Asanoa iriomotensis]GIF61000.1 hypothetical protein Air01nite_70950 [Asanoa iriomotensis]
MKPRHLLVFVLAGLLITPLAGCGEPEGPSFGAEPEPDLTPETHSFRYRTVGLVLENADHGPQLCFNAALSHPPQCGGLDIVGWSWDGLAHESAGGTRWGSFEIVGTYDGERLTLTEPARAGGGQGTTSPMPDFSSACPPPPGGWRVVDDAKATDAALQEALALAESAPGAAGAWIDQNGGENDPKKLVLNVRTTGEVAAHTQRLRAVWGGALCVSPARRTLAELRRIQAALPDVLNSGIDVVANQVTADVYVATDARRQELDARYGPGTVRLTGFLEPM